MKVSFLKAWSEDCAAFAPLLRAPDALEVRRSSGLEVEEVLRRSVESSDGRAEICLFDGEPAAIFGVSRAGLISNVGVPWLLTAAPVERHPVAFLKIAKSVIEAWSREYPVLLQMVDAEYLGAQRLLSILGFEIHAPVPYGAFGFPFCPAMRTQNV